jgi:alkylhydroperoxidase family enzyme
MTRETSAASRLPLVDVQTMEGPAGEVLRTYPRRLNIIAMMAHAETSVLPQLGVGRAIMNDQALPSLQRELLILLAARLDGGRYVWSQHRGIAESHGATSVMIDSIDALDLSAEPFSESDQALLAFGAQVIRGGHVEDRVFERISRHFTGREVVEAILAIGYYMTMNRLTEATHTPLEPAAAQTAMRGAASTGSDSRPY